MNIVALIALIAWPAIAVLLSMWLRAPRSVVACCIAAWLFLPSAGMDLAGPLDLSKTNVTSLGVLLALIVFDPGRLTTLRFSWLDAPMVLLCVSPFFSSVTNGLGAYDGFAESVTSAFSWGVPWLVGRACFRTPEDLRVLAIGVILGGLVYMPLCLYEIRMSPQLHRIVYGFFPHAEFAQTRRFGGFRPNVFMTHGLMVGLWMCLAGVAAFWMWWGGRLKHVLRVPMLLIVPVQAGVAILCKSAGAVAVSAGGVIALLATRWFRTRLVLAALAVFPVAFVGYRAVGGPTDFLVRAVQSMPIIAERTDSLDYRLEADAILLNHAMKRPLFGWGGHGRHRPVNDAGEELVRTDSLWIIVLGQNGLVGLVSLYTCLCLPLLVVARRLPVGALLGPSGAAAVVCAMLPALFAIDSIFNAMPNPIYVLAGAGAMSIALATRPMRRRVRATDASLEPTPADAGQPHDTPEADEQGPIDVMRTPTPRDRLAEAMRGLRARPPADRGVPAVQDGR
ncbi:MAG: O-antigen ligase family protein [Phycisphaerales bacterium]|nr:O-antigen ligase family protein [Phycisphaerales bacterium]